MSKKLESKIIKRGYNVSEASSSNEQLNSYREYLKDTNYTEEQKEEVIKQLSQLIEVSVDEYIKSKGV